MKLLVLSLALALLFTAGSALQCHRCLPEQRGEPCVPAIEQCAQGKNACLTMMTKTQQIKKCVMLIHCLNMRKNTPRHVSCCKTDMCNQQ